jgi:hypothetical protein
MTRFHGTTREDSAKKMYERKNKINYTYLIEGYVGLVGLLIALEDHFNTRKLSEI